MTDLIDVGGYRLAVTATAGIDPPIVFVSGIGEPQTTWRPVIELLDCPNTMITYDRAGIGLSDPRPVNDRPLPYSELSAELLRVLDAARFSGPVVLVAHSMGVLIARSAAAVSRRVAGMVLVDGSVDDFDLWPRSVPARDGDGDHATLLDFSAGAAELARAVYRPMPVIVIARTPGRWTAPQATPQVDARWSAQQRSVAEKLDAVLIIADDAGHRVQDDTPELIVLAIQAVLEAVARGRSAVHVERGQLERAGGRVAPER